MFKRAILSFASFILIAASSAADAKTFRVNVVADPAQMDPITYSEIVSGRIMRNIYEGFTVTTDDGKNAPALAESWEPLTTGPGFRFHLRKGVKFHSGRPFTAKDVKYTYEELLKPGGKGGLSSGYLNVIAGAKELKDGKATELAGVKIVDDNTIDVSFVKPDVLFPIYPVFFMDSGIVAEQGADWMTKVSAGTGPYKFKQWKRGVSVDLDANKDYWGGAPKIDGVSFMIVPNADTALSQYDAGELDFVDVYAAAIRRVLRDDRYAKELIRTPRAQAAYLGMNQNLYAPFKDKRVREAISIAVDRPAMVRGLYGGAAFVLNGAVTPGMPGFDPSLPEPKYDPERAKKLMAEAGFPDGKGLPPIDISSTEAFKDELTYYANQFNRVLGMQVNVKTVERATFIRGMNAGEVAFFPWAWTADYPDAATFLNDMWSGSSPYNRPRWKNADYDKIMAEALTIPDEAKRYELYHKAEKILLDDVGMAPLPMTASVGLKKPNVKNVTLTAFGFSLFNKIEIE
ncbi:ABC transporter substrate-binding protein [Terrarubrum flagellatum]|uniref:ABC transporter substrate-binding protein n=1 Tax=Terrirubrum flagellatum TaxID=2895980 RepID=UPI003144D9BE